MCRDDGYEEIGAEEGEGAGVGEDTVFEREGLGGCWFEERCAGEVEEWGEDG